MMAKAEKEQREAEIAYIQFGFHWEKMEKIYLDKLLHFFSFSSCQTISTEDVYERDHWGITGQNVPNATTSDDAVFLPFRNLLLVSLALPYCLKRNISEIWIGSLKSNPFPDASFSFFQLLEKVIAQASGKTTHLESPFRNTHKQELLLQYPQLPYHLTFSCIDPKKGKHCGSCNKCAERKEAFSKAGLPDPTSYA